jgi:NitT/TauT family transport system substrate-binding protein
MLQNLTRKHYMALGVALVVVIVVVVVVVLGLGGGDDKDKEKTQTSIQLSWEHTAEFAGFYEAVERKYYADENLEVRIDGGGFDENENYIDSIQSVLDGKADFGVVSADTLLLARAEGKPVVAVASIYQHSPVVIVSLKQEGVDALLQPEDLVGKRVGTVPGDVVYDAIMAAKNVDRSGIEEIPQEAAGLDNLINGEIDALVGFVINEPVVLQQQGYEVNLITPRDYGVELYSNLIFTTPQFIADHPDVVERFVRATTKGYQEAMDNPGQAAELTVERNPARQVEIEEASMLASVPLLKPADSEIGMMRAEDWTAIHQTLLDLGILAEPLNVEEAYTLEFVNKIYE